MAAMTIPGIVNSVPAAISESVDLLGFCLVDFIEIRPVTD